MTMDAETWKALIVAVAAAVACWAAIHWFAQRATVRKIVWDKLDDWPRTRQGMGSNAVPYVAFDIAHECNLPVDVVVPHVRTWLRSRGLA